MKPFRRCMLWLFCALVCVHTGCADVLDLRRAPAEPNVCDDDVDCAPGRLCHERRCSDPCIADSDCADQVCVEGACSDGEQRCKPGTRRCNRLAPEQCDEFENWVSTGETCTSNCREGVCDDAPSCDGDPRCADDVSCCKAEIVNGGTFSLRYVASDGRALAVQRTVGSFALDRFEVTYSRFQRFLQAYDTLPRPDQGAGAHPSIPDSGWETAWNDNMALSASSAELQHELSVCAEWNDAAQLTLPARCVNWYNAMLFCIWDRGRLPTEAEWTYAAAGGNETRVYPWSSRDAPDMLDSEHARYGSTSDRSAPSQVGRYPLGQGKYGQDDLAGNVSEWVLDWYRPQLSDASCNISSASSALSAKAHSCAELTPSKTRVIKGGGFSSTADELTTFYREGVTPAVSTDFVGFRCARDPR